MNNVKWSLGQNELQWGLSCYLLQHGNLHLSKQIFQLKKKQTIYPDIVSAFLHCSQKGNETH